jgi:hypothetical protein
VSAFGFERSCRIDSAARMTHLCHPAYWIFAVHADESDNDEKSTVKVAQNNLVHIVKHFIDKIFLIKYFIIIKIGNVALTGHQPGTASRDAAQ